MHPVGGLGKTINSLRMDRGCKALAGKRSRWGVPGAHFAIPFLYVGLLWFVNQSIISAPPIYRRSEAQIGGGGCLSRMRDPGSQSASFDPISAQNQVSEAGASWILLLN